MDDLGFAVAQDPQTADLIRKLDAKKASAVKGSVHVTHRSCSLHCVCVLVYTCVALHRCIWMIPVF